MALAPASDIRESFTPNEYVQKWLSDQATETRPHPTVSRLIALDEDVSAKPQHEVTDGQSKANQANLQEVEVCRTEHVVVNERGRNQDVGIHDDTDHEERHVSSGHELVNSENSGEQRPRRHHRTAAHNGQNDDRSFKYEKRPRRKTRDDKYNLKVDKRQKSARKDHVRDHDGTRKRRKKSGMALNDDFQAPNVSQVRLSVRCNLKRYLNSTSN